jgi:hypothetical protein
MKPFTSALRAMDDATADDGEAHVAADDRRCTGREQVAIEDDQAGVQPGAPGRIVS